jgi:hypothetical protein
MGILIFKGLTARRLCKSFGVKGLSNVKCPIEIVISELDITLPVRHERMCAGDVNP